MKRKKEKVYKRVKWNKHFAPIILGSFVVAIWLLVNFQRVSYHMNSNDFEKLTGTVAQRTVDGFISRIPICDIEYTFNDKEYHYDLYDFYGFRPYQNVTIYVNKNAPSFLFVLDDNYISRYNNYFYIVFGVCILVYIRKLYYVIRYKKQRKENKKQKKEKQLLMRKYEQEEKEE